MDTCTATQHGTPVAVGHPRPPPPRAQRTHGAARALTVEKHAVEHVLATHRTPSKHSTSRCLPSGLEHEAQRPNLASLTPLSPHFRLGRFGNTGSFQFPIQHAPLPFPVRAQVADQPANSAGPNSWPVEPQPIPGPFSFYLYFKQTYRPSKIHHKSILAPTIMKPLS